MTNTSPLEAAYTICAILCLVCCLSAWRVVIIQRRRVKASKYNGQLKLIAQEGFVTEFQRVRRAFFTTIIGFAASATPPVNSDTPITVIGVVFAVYILYISFDDAGHALYRLLVLYRLRQLEQNRRRRKGDGHDVKEAVDAVVEAATKAASDAIEDHERHASDARAPE